MRSTKQTANAHGTYQYQIPDYTNSGLHRGLVCRPSEILPEVAVIAVVHFWQDSHCLGIVPKFFPHFFYYYSCLYPSCCFAPVLVSLHPCSAAMLRAYVQRCAPCLVWSLFVAAGCMVCTVGPLARDLRRNRINPPVAEQDCP